MVTYRLTVSVIYATKGMVAMSNPVLLRTEEHGLCSIKTSTAVWFNYGIMDIMYGSTWFM